MRPGWRWRVRGALFIASVALSLVVFVPVLLLLWPLPHRLRFGFSNLWCRFFVVWIRWFMGIGHRIRGLEHLPPGPRIYYVKHQSTWETLALQTVFDPYVWIVKREALWIPFFGWGLACLRPIAIDRRAGRQAVEQVIEQGRRRLLQGLGVCIFPEGTRVAPGQHRRYGLSGALLAQATGAAVVPIAHNAGRFWPPKRMGGFRPGTIEVVIGAPLLPDELSPEAMTEQLKRWMDQTADTLALEADIHRNFSDHGVNGVESVVK